MKSAHPLSRFGLLWACLISSDAVSMVSAILGISMNQPSHPLTLDRLASDGPALEHQQVHVRGFLYRLDDDTWILASQPNLKSCCVSKQPLDQRLHVRGKLEKEHPQKVVELEGTLKIASLEQSFHLENASLITTPEASTLPWVTLTVVLIACAFGAGYRYWLGASRN